MKSNFKKYGVPFRGSKCALVDWIFKYIPSAENFYDIFAGGCSMSHYALTHSRWNNVYSNDLGRGSRLFTACTTGELYINPTDHLNNLPNPKMMEYMEKDEFDKLKKVPYKELELWQDWLMCCWSFGNDYLTFRIGKDYNDNARLYHNAVVYLDLKPFEKVAGCDLSFIKDIPNVFDRFNKTLNYVMKNGNKIPHFNSRAYACMSRLNAIYESISEHNNSSAGVSRFFDIKTTKPTFSLTNQDYRDVEIKPNSVIYADPPYIGSDYGGAYLIKQGQFDHEAFYQWAESQNELVIISEYRMPEDRFVCISEHKQIGSTGWDNFTHENGKRKVEKLFVPKHQLDMVKRFCDKEIR